MIDITHYTYRVTWSQDDQEYVGLCTEFPKLSCLSSVQITAFESIVQLVTDVVEDLQKSGELIPEPFSKKDFSRPR